MRLSAFDPESAFEPRSAELLAMAECGDRRDCGWYRLTPPIQRGELSSEGPYEVVLLAPRHAGVSFDDARIEPVHVYVCAVAGSDLVLTKRIEPSQLKILAWGLLAAG